MYCSGHPHRLLLCVGHGDPPYIGTELVIPGECISGCFVVFCSSVTDLHSFPEESVPGGGYFETVDGGRL